MPIRIIEGVRDERTAELRRRNMERRFFELAAAVRDHEADSARAPGSAPRPADERLYRRLRQVCGDASTEELAAAPRQSA